MVRKIKRIKNFIDKWISKAIKHYTEINTPSSLCWLVKKYPKGKYLWWLLFQLKENSMFIMLAFVLWAINHLCNPYLLCEPCLNITRGIGLPDSGLINFNHSLFIEQNITNIAGGT